MKAPTAPTAPTPKWDSIPPELKALPQWVCWKYLKPAKDGDKWRKVPFQVTGTTASTTDFQTWNTFEAARRAYESGGYAGVGFVFSEDDPYVGIDLDGVLENGFRDEAQKWVWEFASYTEVSVSLKGLHIIAKGKLPENAAKKVEPFEAYDTGRYFTVTGDTWEGMGEIREAQAVVDELQAHMVSLQKSKPKAEPQADKPQGIGQGNRHDVLVKTAAAIAKAGHGRAAILEALRGINRGFPDGPKPEAELVKIVDWATGKTDQIPAEVIDWGGVNPKPLPSELPAAPILHRQLVPEPLRSWVFTVADSRCVPPEFYFVSVAVPLLSAASWITLSPDRDGRFLTRPNVWGLVIGPPSAKKSTALTAGLSFLKRLEAEERDKNALERFNNEATRDALKAEEDSTRKMIAKAKDPHQKEALRLSLAEIKERLADVEARLRLVRYIVTEATVEKIADILVHTPHGLLLTRDEATAWLRGFDRKEHEADRSFFLEAWTGCENFAVDRVVRGSKIVPYLLLSLMMTVQPGPLERYIQEAVEWSGKDGFLARFQILAWPSELPEWSPKECHADDGRIMQLFRYALSRENLVEQDGKHVLKFSPQGQAVYEQWQLELNRRTRSELKDTSPAYAMHVQKYEGLLPKLAFLFQLCRDFERGGKISEIGHEAAIQAAALVEFFDDTAKRLYSVEIDPGRSAARLLAERILKKDVRDGEHERDIYRAGWGGLPDRRAVVEAVIQLEALGWLKRLEVHNHRVGRPETVIRINPRVFDLYGGQNGKVD